LNRWLAVSLVLLLVIPASAVILWSDPDTTLARETGPGTDILGGAVKRDDSANDTLYFKFHVGPLSDMDTEEYFAAFELFEGEAERLAIGNALKAWAYSAFNRGEAGREANNAADYIDLRSSRPEPFTNGVPLTYQNPRRGVPATIIFKIQYVAAEDDLVTVWLNPDLGPGANEASQPESLTTRFNANGGFDEIRLRHGGKGGGWAFSDLAIATSFSDFVDVSSARPGQASLGALSDARAVGFQTWQKEQGLSSGPLRALAQTAEGYLWVGGNEGLARFDGLRFVAFGMQQGVKAGPVTTLLGDSRGALWIGSTENGLSCWQFNHLASLTVRDGLPANSITALAEDSAGRLWVGTDAGLVLWQDGRLLPLSAAEPFRGHRITALCHDHEKRMWIGVKGVGVFQFTGEKFVPVTGDTDEDLLKDSHCLLVDQVDRLWVGVGEDVVLCRDAAGWHHHRIARSRGKSHISALAEEPDGTVWAGCAGGGLVQFKDGKPLAIPASSGLAGTLVEALLTDREGGLWVGTDGGLNRLRRKTLFSLSQGEGLGIGAAQGLAEVMPGVVWVGKPNGGLYRWDGKSFSRLSAAGLSPHDSQVTALLVTHEGFCWVASTNSLLLYKDPIAAADEAMTLKPAPPHIISLAEDPQGNLWLGTQGGKLWELHEGAWLEHTNLSQTNSITTLVADPNGAIWIGTDGNGLYRLRNGGFQHLGKSAGLSSDAIRTLYLDRQSALWVGTADAGLTRWREERAARFTTREGLADNSISQILEDDEQRLWLGTSRGIALVSKQRLDELAEGKLAGLYPQLFGRAEGMFSEECTGGFCPAGLKTKSGLLWFSTLKGVVVVNPRSQVAAPSPPNTVLEEVLVDDVPLSLVGRGGPNTPAHNPLPGIRVSAAPTPKPVRISPGKHRLEFRYTSLGFVPPEQTRFRYRLEGLDTEWVEAGTRRTAFYPYLPPASYHFRAAACGGDGVWTASEAGLELTVLKHFWQTWWFISSAGMACLLSAVGTARLVEKRKLHRRLKLLEQERALESERTRIARDLHDEMGAKLCRISFLSEHARRGQLPPTELHEQITSISNASREVLHSLDEIVWAVNPQNDTLEHLASYIGQYAEEYFQMTGIQCELDIPTQLPPHPLSSQIRHHLFLAAHEAMTNILKHSGATCARISMACNNGTFEIVISDNGKAFDLAGRKSEFAAGVSRDGLSNMSKRLADIGGHCRIEPVSGHGTTLHFTLPLQTFQPNK
jgi:ligand-binding sensor domain-containing protein/signal transduction histidine kinase